MTNSNTGGMAWKPSWTSKESATRLPDGMLCFCVGKQNGEPYCPCMMKAKGVFRRNGRWIEPEHDLGEA